MGMFDSLYCKYPLPISEVQEMQFQTKDLESFLNNYLIDEQGVLWREEYDTENRSDPNAKGVARLLGSMARVNKKMVAMPDFNDQIEFYSEYPSYGEKRESCGWTTFLAQFKNGKIASIKIVEDDTPDYIVAARQAKEIETGTGAVNRHKPDRRI